MSWRGGLAGSKTAAKRCTEMIRPVGPTLMKRVSANVTNEGLAMHIKKVRVAIARMVMIFAVVLSVGLLAPSADAHHSYAMYDGAVYRVFTGVIVRIIPNAAHFEMHFVPLNEKRDDLIRDEKGEPLVWVIQMESAAQVLK